MGRSNRLGISAASVKKNPRGSSNPHCRGQNTSSQFGQRARNNQQNTALKQHVNGNIASKTNQDTTTTFDQSNHIAQPRKVLRKGEISTRRTEHSPEQLLFVCPVAPLNQSNEIIETYMH